MALMIKIENIGKKYLINHQKNENYETLRDLMASKAKSLLNKLNSINFKLVFLEFKLTSSQLLSLDIVYNNNRLSQIPPCWFR